MTRQAGCYLRNYGAEAWGFLLFFRGISRIIAQPIAKGWKQLNDKPHLDMQTTVGSLRAEIVDFVEERNWEQYHAPKSLAMSIAIEAAEIMEHFQWVSNEESQAMVRNEQARAQVADEMADVLIYCLALANQADIDISTAVKAKLERNRSRFPIGYMPPKHETSS